MRAVEIIAADLDANIPNGDRFLKKLLWAIFFCPGFKLICLWRITASLHSRGGVRRVLSRFLFNWIVFLYGCYISPLARIGAGLRFPHPTGIVVGEGVVIGELCCIYQNVTLGLRKPSENNYPRLGSHVTLSAGSVLLGGIVVDERVMVGANSVVLCNCPAGSTVVGIPGRILHENSVR